MLVEIKGGNSVRFEDSFIELNRLVQKYDLGNPLKETIYIEKDKLRCKSCECQLTKENTEEYIKRTNTENQLM